MGMDYQYHLIHAQAIPERRGTLDLLIEAAREGTLGEDLLLLAAPEAGDTAFLPDEPLGVLGVGKDGARTIPSRDGVPPYTGVSFLEDALGRNLNPGAFARFLSHFLRPGAVLRYECDEGPGGFLLQGPGRVEVLVPALCTQERGWVAWL
ncbi:hypothetical protein Mterra_00192 [Calidithermus terrae]|uniref:Uncharacterized protein n=1 Tax=Calidithermus terrae TaxID=1408545 RepID=A0A399F3C6_9DEIN|nr:hypothetical protein [Calidithermus terrae]RIH90698.1 hypothetical protein Mterra_00192 [Calidithermus terrae]